MTIRKKVFWSGAALAMFLTIPVPLVYGQAPGHLMPFGGALRGMTRLTGEVICVGCSLQEAREARQNAGDLYLLRHPDGQVVLRVDSFYDPAEHIRWESIAGLSHRLSARAPAWVFAELMAEENLFKEVEVTGLLRSNLTFDISQVRVIE
jgi:hypothetical protein